MNKKLKPMIITTISILVAVYILQQWTPINIISASIFKSSKLDSYPYLKDGVISDHYTVQRLPGPFTPLVTYNAKHNFFLVVGYQYVKKIDAKGNELISIKTDKYSELVNFTHYLFNENGVYDLSKEDVKKVLFEEIINQDSSLEPKAWIKLFNQYYKAAQIVVVGQKGLSHEKNSGFPIYFKIEEKWIKLFTEKHETKGYYSDSFAFLHSYKNLPVKLTQTILLKDATEKVFSNSLEEYAVQLYKDNENNIKNYAFKYSNIPEIKSIFFEKEFVYETLAGGYTPIPIEYAGTAYYQLKIKDAVFSFKEKAVKRVFMGLNNGFHWYILPDKHFQNSDVSFLEFRAQSSSIDNGSSGLYIVKKIKK